MLRKIRITLALFFLVCITLLFLDFTGTFHAWFGWMARIQFLPAVLAVNLGVVCLLVVLTFVFGRIYCSVICPLGIFQDVIAWLGKRRKKLPYRYSPPVLWLRYGLLAVFILVLLGGFTGLAALFAPYSAYGRMVSALGVPLYQWANNGLAYVAWRMDSYAFYSVDVWTKGIVTFLIAAVTFMVITILAWRNGRTYCNAICPVGTVLGFISRFSLFRPVMDSSACNGCGLCSRHCKAACIDPEKHQIDYSRCVVCMDCIGTCRRQAIRYGRRPLPAKSAEACGTEVRTGQSRRALLSAVGLFVVTMTLKAQKKKVDGGLAIIEDKEIPNRITSLKPPGSMSVRHFTGHCTACQLCVSVCPNQVLRPSGSMANLMQPEMSYERGYCRPECTKCSEVCPAGAIRPVTPADKSAIQIGRAVWVKKNCIPLRDGVDCGNCARHCPSKAIEMISPDPGDDDAPRIPAINTERCIGCGACENLCPARPFSAIYVEGIERHRNI